MSYIVTVRPNMGHTGRLSFQTNKQKPSIKQNPIHPTIQSPYTQQPILYLSNNQPRNIKILMQSMPSHWGQNSAARRPKDSMMSSKVRAKRWKERYVRKGKQSKANILRPAK